MKLRARFQDRRWIYTVGDCDSAADLHLCIFKEIDRDFDTGHIIYFEDLFLCYDNEVKILHSDELKEIRKMVRDIDTKH